MSSSDPMPDTTTTGAAPIPNEEAGERTQERQQKTGRPAKQRRPISFDTNFAKRFMRAETILSTRQGLELAQFVADTRSDNVAYLLSQLSQRTIRKKIESLASVLSKLEGADRLTVGVLLAEMFSGSKEMPILVYRVLNVVAPEHDFGRPTGDAARDALAIAGKWEDGIDLSIVRDLLI